MPSYGGTKSVDWKTGQVIEGSSSTTKAGSWKGTGRRITGWKKKKKPFGFFSLKTKRTKFQQEHKIWLYVDKR